MFYRDGSVDTQEVRARETFYGRELGSSALGQEVVVSPLHLPDPIRREFEAELSSRDDIEPEAALIAAIRKVVDSKSSSDRAIA